MPGWPSGSASRKLSGVGRPVIRRHKYGARRTEYRGEWYDSAAEAHYAAILELQKKAGRIVRWERGTPQILIDGPTKRLRITYRPDFLVYYDNGACEAVDVKGVVPEAFRLRAILWRRKFPGIPLRVVDKDGNQKWSLDGRAKERAA